MCVRKGVCVCVCVSIGPFSLHVINFLKGPYLIVTTGRSLVGKIEGQDIYEASGFQILPFARSTLHLSESQVLEKDKYV